MTSHDTINDDSVFTDFDSDSDDIFHDAMDDFPNTAEITGKKNPNARQEVTVNDLNNLILPRVKLTSCVLGQGSYGTVYKAEYNGIACAAKRVDLSVTHFTERVEQNFLLECLQHSTLSHSNIVKMLGVFSPKKETLPVLVMELMEYNLTQLLKKSQNIPMYVKLSILQDVSRGMCYLHAQNPPIVHQALYSDNILFTKGLIAKLGDFKTGAETVSDQALLSTRRNRASNDFLPDSHSAALKYELPLNVFSFGCIVCHVITQKWPITHNNYFKEQRSVKPHNISKLKRTENDPAQPFPECDYTDLTMRYMIVDWCIEKHQYYINQIDDNTLKHLVEACLQRNPNYRPHMSQVCKRITNVMQGEFMC